jgi:hypothetical protein
MKAFAGAVLATVLIAFGAFGIYMLATTHDTTITRVVTRTAVVRTTAPPKVITRTVTHDVPVPAPTVTITTAANPGQPGNAPGDSYLGGGTNGECLRYNGDTVASSPGYCAAYANSYGVINYPNGTGAP